MCPKNTAGTGGGGLGGVAYKDRGYSPPRAQITNLHTENVPPKWW